MRVPQQATLRRRPRPAFIDGVTSPGFRPTLSGCSSNVPKAAGALRHRQWRDPSRKSGHRWRQLGQGLPLVAPNRVANGAASTIRRHELVRAIARRNDLTLRDAVDDERPPASARGPKCSDE